MRYIDNAEGARYRAAEITEPPEHDGATGFVRYAVVDTETGKEVQFCFSADAALRLAQKREAARGLFG